MKRIFIIFIALPLLLVFSQQEIQFDRYFNDQTMRIDYFHIGDKNTDIITIDHIYQYGIWAGNLKNLIDNFNNGSYYVKIYNVQSKRLIYSRGYDSYFREYQATTDADQGIQRTYHESVLIPYPKSKILFTIEKRDSKNELSLLYQREIDPADIAIIREDIVDQSIKIYNSHISGNPHNKIDMAILGEGYTEKEENKFKIDLKKYSAIFFNYEPYKSFRSSFNLYGVLKFSQESGIDEPGADIYKRTSLNTTFNSLGSERYILTEDNKSVRDIAAAVPYETILIMINHKRYGGGGIYNLFCTFPVDNYWSEYLIHHEFGHSFSGLADEYYTSDVAYTDFYSKKIEPVEPNITALLDPANLKWKDLISEEIEIPTPWEKEQFDKMDYSWQKKRQELNNKIADLKKNNASDTEIAAAENEYLKNDIEHNKKVHQYLKQCKNWGLTGAFEGAGYSPRGLYRPMIDCIMFSKGKKPFCKVCEAAVIKMIRYYSE